MQPTRKARIKLINPDRFVLIEAPTNAGILQDQNLVWDEISGLPLEDGAYLTSGNLEIVVANGRINDRHRKAVDFYNFYTKIRPVLLVFVLLTVLLIFYCN